MAELVTIDLDTVLVDPGRLSPRSVWVDEAHLARMVGDLEEGRSLPPLVVAPPADPYAEWCSCPGHFNQRQRAEWTAAERSLPWTRRPLRPEWVLLDGVSRYWAIRQFMTGPRTRTVRSEAVIETPVASATAALGRAVALNYRNARSLTDGDLRGSFERLWLGRAVKASHERWTVAGGALPLEEIAALCGRSLAWCAGMIQYARVTYTLGGLDLGLRKAMALARLAEGEWAPFALMSDGTPRLHVLVDEAGRARSEQPRTVFEMTARDLEWLVELAQRGQAALGAGASPAEQPSGAAAGEPAVDEHGQYLLDFEPDWQTPLDQVRRIGECAPRLDGRQAYEQYVAMAPVVAEVTRVWKQLRERARAAGYEVS